MWDGIVLNPDRCPTIYFGICAMEIKVYLDYVCGEWALPKRTDAWFVSLFRSAFH